MANCAKCRFSLNLQLFSVNLKSAPVKHTATYCYWVSHQRHSLCTYMSLWWDNDPSLWLSWAVSIPKWVSILWHAACAPSDAKLLEGGVFMYIYICATCDFYDEKGDLSTSWLCQSKNVATIQGWNDANKCDFSSQYRRCCWQLACNTACLKTKWYRSTEKIQMCLRTSQSYSQAYSQWEWFSILAFVYTHDFNGIAWYVNTIHLFAHISTSPFVFSVNKQPVVPFSTDIESTLSRWRMITCWISKRRSCM